MIYLSLADENYYNWSPVVKNIASGLLNTMIWHILWAEPNNDKKLGMSSYDKTIVTKDYEKAFIKIRKAILIHLHVWLNVIHC